MAEVTLVERLKNALSNYTSSNSETKNIEDLLDLTAEESKTVPGGINCNQILFDTALNFSSEFTKADADDFRIIYQYLQDNHEDEIEPLVFKNTLTHRSDISKLADTLHEKLAENFEFRCGFNDYEQSMIEISVFKQITLVEGLKNALSNYTRSRLETKNVADLLDLIAEESKTVPGGINCHQILLETALNFYAKYSNYSRADANDFHIIYQYLQDNNEEQLGPYVFKNTLTPKKNLSKLVKALDKQLAGNYHLVYDFIDIYQFSTEIRVYNEDSLFERFKHFFERIPTGKTVAFVDRSDYRKLFSFIKFLARLLGREEPIDAWSRSSKVDSWLSFNGQGSQDLFAKFEDFGTKKTEFVIELSDDSKMTPKVPENATSKYTFIQYSYFDARLLVDILESMKDQQYQIIVSKIMNQIGKDPLCLKTLIGI